LTPFSPFALLLRSPLHISIPFAPLPLFLLCLSISPTSIDLHHDGFDTSASCLGRAMYTPPYLPPFLFLPAPALPLPRQSIAFFDEPFILLFRPTEAPSPTLVHSPALFPRGQPDLPPNPVPRAHPTLFPIGSRPYLAQCGLFWI